MSLKTPLKHAKQLGSAKSGTEHFWHERVSFIALVPLLLWFIFSVAMWPNTAGYTVAWFVKQPWNAFLLTLFIPILFYYLFLVTQVVIEDYVHGEFAKVVSIIVLKLLSVFAVAASLFSIFSIYFGS